MDIRRTVTRLVAFAPGVIAIAVAFSGALPLPDSWDSGRLTFMIGALLMVSGASYLYLYAQGEREEKKTEAIEGRLDSMRAAVSSLRDAKTLTDQVRAQIDMLPKWGNLLSRYASSYMLSRIDSILLKEHFELRGGFFFQDFYRAVFKALPACSLIATADASRDYMWTGRDLNGLFHEFTKERGGTLDRIFFLREPAQLHDSVVREIMLGQHQAGVRVHWIVRSALPEALFMIAEESGAFGWQLRTNARGEIDHVDVSWNAQTAGERYAYLRSVLHHPQTQKFAP